MGLFDESDSDDDDKRPPSYTNLHGGIEGSSGGIEGKEEEEEDALDLYMKSLDDKGLDNAPTSKNNNASGGGGGGGGGRLDVEAEDEATSHWEIATKAPSKVNSTLLPKHEHDVSLQAQDNKSVNLHGFVRAGTTKAQSSASQTNNIHNGMNNNKDDNDDDDDEFTNLSNKVREHQVQLLHTEIDPLDKINHDTIQYNTFNRIFYKPSDTNHGHAWRKEHDVICTPSYFDPILGFGELSSTNNGSGSGVFPEELIRTIAQQGYDAPTLVQSQTLSVALSGNDALITVSFVTYVIYECLLHSSLCVTHIICVSMISFLGCHWIRENCKLWLLPEICNCSCPRSLYTDFLFSFFLKSSPLFGP